MDFHLDTLLNLPNITVLTCYQKEGFTVLKLDLLNPQVGCNYCGKATDELHQNRL
jgi:transposase